MLDFNIELLDRSENVGATSRLLRLLTALDTFYVPPISSMTDLPTYCSKLINHAEVLIAQCDENDIGCVAVYANDQVRRRAFISSVGVKPEYHGRGIATSLLYEAMAQAKGKGMECMRLDVSQLNYVAISLYRKVGFIEVDRSLENVPNGWVRMERPL